MDLAAILGIAAAAILFPWLEARARRKKMLLDEKQRVPEEQQQGNQQRLEEQVRQSQSIAQKKKVWHGELMDTDHPQRRDGGKFEREAGAVFKNMGFTVRHTGGSGDGGIDLVLDRNNERAIVQCKNQKDVVNIEEVKNLYRVLSRQRKINPEITQAYFLTTSYFTGDSWRYVRSRPIKLIDGNAFFKMKSESEMVNANAQPEGRREQAVSIPKPEFLSLREKLKKIVVICGACATSTRIPTSKAIIYTCPSCRTSYRWDPNSRTSTRLPS